jgi:hypothetical protein
MGTARPGQAAGGDHRDEPDEGREYPLVSFGPAHLHLRAERRDRNPAVRNRLTGPSAALSRRGR